MSEAHLIVCTIKDGDYVQREQDATNVEEHGISLRRAADFDLENARMEADTREDYGEDRWNALGFLDGNLYNLTFTMRDGFIRAISLRKASRTEKKLYAEMY